MGYQGDALTNSIIPKFGQFHAAWANTIFVFGLSCFLIAVVWRLAEVVFTDEPKPFPVFSLLGSLILSILMIAQAKQIFTGCISACDYIADSIYNVSKTKELVQAIWGTPGQQEVMGVSLFNLTFSRIASACSSLISMVAFYAIAYLRYFILIILFLLSPFVFTLYLVPLFGGRYLAQFFVTLIQVASWPIFVSILNLVMESFSVQKQATDSIEYIVLLCLYCVCLTFIPKIAALLLGGGDFSILSAATVGLSTMAVFNRQKQALNFAGKTVWNSPSGQAVRSSLKDAMPFKRRQS